MKKMLTLLATLMTTIIALADSPRPAKPNIVLLLTDDLGWQDVKCYDIDEPSPMETPNIDALAKKGVMFWQAYSPAPVCSPSRVSILSGQHPARTEVTAVAGGTPPRFHHPRAGRTGPWNAIHMPDSVVSLAEALKREGYATGHSGKWHFSPEPGDIGFDSTVQHRGVQGGMPNRLTGFATRDPEDPFRLDENGFPYDVPQHAAMDFLAANKDGPFFLYYATWLVHGPISMKSEQLLQKYVKKLGVELKPEHKDAWPMEGQTNPFYDAMVEQLDYYLGQVFSYLETTEDPRWPGHKLVENTYIIFTSDNGGMENRPPIDRFTENAPLDRGKISTKEGGTRVPLIITGPGIPAGVQTDVMANGLDFYPTILSWIGADKPEGAIFDGCDLSPLLTGDPTDPSLVRDAEGNVRDTMFWHFPQMEGTTSIRVGDYKLRRSAAPDAQQLELYQLYRTENGKQVRVDIEEAHNLAGVMPGKAKELEAKRAALVAELGGRYGHFNADYPGGLQGKEKAPRILSHKIEGNQFEISYQHNGADIVHADFFFTRNAGSRNETWHRETMMLVGKNKAIVEVPDDASHCLVNLVDANNFLAVYPKVDGAKLQREKKRISAAAIFLGYPEPQAGTPLDFGARFEELSKATEGAYILISDGFESGESPIAQTSQKGVEIVKTTPVADGHCLKLSEVEGLPHAWLPHVGQDFRVPKTKQAGTLRLAFDIMFDAEAPGKLGVLLRDSNAGRHYATAGDLEFGEDAFRANGKAFRGVTPGTWYHVEIAQDIGPNADKAFTVTVTTADGGTSTASLPFKDRKFRSLTAFGVTGNGDQGSHVYLDNVVCRVE